MNLAKIAVIILIPGLCLFAMGCPCNSDPHAANPCSNDHDHTHVRLYNLSSGTLDASISQNFTHITTFDAVAISAYSSYIEFDLVGNHVWLELTPVTAGVGTNASGTMVPVTADMMHTITVNDSTVSVSTP